MCKWANVVPSYSPHCFRKAHTTHTFEETKNLGACKQVLRHDKFDNLDHYVDTKSKMLEELYNPEDALDCNYLSTNKKVKRS